jgi:hypothetical protein
MHSPASHAKTFAALEHLTAISNLKGEFFQESCLLRVQAKRRER